MTWLEQIKTANQQFRKNIQLDSLPVTRQPCPYAVITCMDPRVNLEAIGIPGFTACGASDNQVRVIRTIGAMHESRSLVIGIHLAGFREVAVLMHTDCGCCLAHDKIDVIESNMATGLNPVQQAAAKKIVDQSTDADLRSWLNTFEDPRVAVKKEVAAIKASPFVPEDLVVHGLVYHLADGSVDLIVDGYQ